MTQGYARPMNTYTLDEIIERAGGPTRVAKHFHITPQAVSKWRKISTERLLDMAVMADVPIEVLIAARREEEARA